MKKYTLLFVLGVMSMAACKKQGPAKEKPEIAFVGLSPDVVANGNFGDTVLISLRYTIAASSIGTGTEAPQIFYKDSRDQSIITQPFPNELAEDLPDENLNVSGTITLRLNAGNFLVLRPDRPDGDTVQYEIYLKDMKKGVESNKVVTSNIYIVP